MLRLHYSDWQPRIRQYPRQKRRSFLLRHRIELYHEQSTPSDRTGSISVRTVEGQSILVLASDYDGILYETWVYTKDGSLLELFSEQGSGLTVEDGPSYYGL